MAKIAKREPVERTSWYVADKRDRPIEFSAFINSRQVWTTQFFTNEELADSHLAGLLESDSVGRIQQSKRKDGSRPDDLIIPRSEWHVHSEVVKF